MTRLPKTSYLTLVTANSALEKLRFILSGAVLLAGGAAFQELHDDEDPRGHQKPNSEHPCCSNIGAKVFTVRTQDPGVSAPFFHGCSYELFSEITDISLRPQIALAIFVFGDLSRQLGAPPVITDHQQQLITKQLSTAVTAAGATLQV